ncbi:TadE family protein [Nakamurella deserti]|uniref:TadE family protein n=1 Tax=Nakamurella deserti TaxID=2164074 RepID=UPI000DBE58C1|nr:TadE family protein [Nakamurella deserti]
MNVRPDRAADRADRGSAVAEFAMVGVVLILLFFAVVQGCLWIYTRHILGSAAAEAARYAGLSEVSSFDVTRRVADHLGDGVIGGVRGSLVCTRSGTAVMTEVRCTVPAPGLVGLLDGVLPAVTAVGHSAREGIVG